MSTGPLTKSAPAVAVAVLALLLITGCSLLEGTKPTPHNGYAAISNSIDWYLSIINSNASDRARASAALNLSLAYTRTITPPDTDKAYKYMRMCAEFKGEKRLTLEESERLMMLRSIIELRTELAETRKLKGDLELQKRDLELQKQELNEAIDKLEDLQMEHEMKRRQVK